ncbi:GNAT family N-acetyltransferase [Alteraurantiacibacter aquimixticola]|uniref:GNAT family N-acetyltransferase n=1 Tax=Alteraurantiacibacter aquimixticola TaxID=2489173 RepID=A0A4T3F1Y5_9SPHN|nr:GNAT family N-acetyltransferase [Alteraurantiacibacter aquimixticola]TIX51098.1 GNAT family N-acetyltransferase [Alteraurantiacibacter aquimixticola]
MSGERLPPDAFRLIEDDLTAPEVVALLQQHLDEMHQFSPPEMVHAMPVERLRQTDVTFYSAWHDGQLAAVGAIRHIDDQRGELKSMRASDLFRGRGAGEAVLLQLMAEARRRGYRWLGLETGRTEPFHPALGLYRKHGFSECAPFGDYLPGDFSICLSRNLD